LVRAPIVARLARRRSCCWYTVHALASPPPPSFCVPSNALACCWSGPWLVRGHRAACDACYPATDHLCSEHTHTLTTECTRRRRTRRARWRSASS
jgi:hypothetical protein